MVEVEVYTSMLCPYCWRAKRLLQQKGVAFQEIDVGFHPQRRREMTARAGRHTVPQIFIGGQAVGGSDELHALEENGELDRLLAGAAA
jgi:glutaredoxin 3